VIDEIQSGDPKIGNETQSVQTPMVALMPDAFDRMPIAQVMPIAQFTMIELLHALDAALHGGEPLTEIEYRTIRIAIQAGNKRTERSTLPAIQAACRRLCRPQQFPSAESAAAASGSKAPRCTFWVTKIQKCIADETGGTATTICRPQQFPSSASAAAANGCKAPWCTFWLTKLRKCIADETGDTATAISDGRTGGAGSSSAPPKACSQEEVAALDGLISLGERGSNVPRTRCDTR
jgi:hypothetical protein